MHKATIYQTRKRCGGIAIIKEEWETYHNIFSCSKYVDNFMHITFSRKELHLCFSFYETNITSS